MKRLANPAWAILEYLWYPLLVFASTPYFLKVLGAGHYGLWMLLTATVGVGTILNVGTGAATIKLVSGNIGGNASEGLSAIVGSALAVALLGGGALAALVSGVFVFGGDVLFDKMGDRHMVLLSGSVAALVLWIEQLDNVFSSAVKGAEKYGAVARVEMACKAIQIALAFAAIALGGGLEAVFAALVIVAFARLAAKAQLARTLLQLTWRRPTGKGVRDFLYLSRWGWMQGMGGMLFASADRFLVGSLYGAATLSQYAVAAMLPQQIHAVAAAGMSVIFPMVSRKRMTDKSFPLLEPALRMLAINLVLSGAIAVVLWLLGDRIFALWLHDPMPPEAVLTYRFLIVANFILALSIVPHYILLGLGSMRFVAVNACFAGLVAFIVMVELAQRLGLHGVGAGRVFYGALYGIGVGAVFLLPAVKAWRRRS